MSEHKPFEITLTVVVYRPSAVEEELLKELSVFDNSSNSTYAPIHIDKIEEVK